MDVWEALLGRRTIRRYQSRPVPGDVLSRLVDCARLAPSGANRQPLEFIAVSDSALVEKVAGYVRWAAYIHPAGDPPPGHGPVAFVATLVNKGLAPDGAPYDVGAAMMSMVLAARAERIGSCWMGAIDRPAIARILKVPKREWSLDSVLALGFSDECPVAEPCQGSVEYWKDDHGVLHVPKRALEDVLHWNVF